MVVNGKYTHGGDVYSREVSLDFSANVNPFGTPEKVADVIDFFLGEASAWITGQCLVADGGHQLT